MELRGYQKAGVDFLTEVQRCILADEMGVGKTPQLITAAHGRTLVVAPPGLHSNWAREINRWSTGDAEFTVTSYHSLVDRNRKDGRGRVLGLPRSQWRGPWDTVVFDEAHHLKGRSTGYAMASVTGIAPYVPRVYMATGTPIRNWAHELFMLLRAIYPKDERFRSFWNWAERWFTVTDEVTYFKGKQQKHKAIGKLRDITDWETFTARNGIDGHWLRRTLESPEVDIELPALNTIQVLTDMGPTQRKAYRSMERQFFAEHAGVKLIALSQGARWHDLMRMASGLCFHPEIGQGPSSKLDAMQELLESLGSEQLVVFGWYRETIEGLSLWLSDRAGPSVPCHGGMSGKAQEEARESFRRGDAQFLVGSYSVMGEGHNLTEASKMVLFEHPPVPAVVDQAMKRIHRFGQERPCTVWSLVTADTTDEYYVERVLPTKRSQSDAFVDAADLHRFLRR